MKHFAIFRRFRLNLRAMNANAEGASEKFRVPYRETTYDAIIFKFQAGAFAPLHLHADAHAINQSTFDPCYALVLGVFRTMLISVPFI